IFKNGEIPMKPYYMNLNDEITLKIQNPTNKDFQFSHVQIGLVFGYHQQIQQRKDNTQSLDLDTTQFSREPQLSIYLIDLFDKKTIYKKIPTQLIITIYDIKERTDGEIKQATIFTLGKEYIFWIMDNIQK
ncbi:MAG: hypothetical protein K8R74_12420, partial [Bacteroidales bacterium]|nr:hypothetical protein [Bacteroidales bacterium]